MQLTILFAIFFHSICPTLQNRPLVHLPIGSIRGTKSINVHNKIFYSFKKIPYAAPPLGNLRFQAPQPYPSWNGILDCTNLNVRCYQLTFGTLDEAEDCLYLNIYSPEVPDNNHQVSFPVMFYIHGGGFTDGSSQPYRPDLFIDNDVLLVTINYRLGPFGFLSTQDKVIPGNNGLKDQLFALQWVHKYISFFGGDPRRITIFGHSAGSASVGYHLLNLKSEGLFWAAICQSGSVVSPWAYQRKARNVAFKFAEFLNSTFARTNNSEDLLEFLQSVNAKDIKRANGLYNKYVFNGTSEDFVALEGLHWAPTLEPESEDAFISKKMYGLLKSGQVIKVPVLIGFTSEENLNFHLDRDQTEGTMKAYDADVTNLIPVDMEITDPNNRTKMGLLIKEMYTGGSPFSKNLGIGVTFSSDNDMTRPIMKQAEFLSKHTETYFYTFSYDGKLGSYDILYDGAARVGHGEELMYLFCFRYYCRIDNFPESDKITRNRLIKIWTNFAKFGKPTPDKSALLQNISWPRLAVSENNFKFLDVGENLRILNYPKKGTYLRWNQLYSSLGRDDFDTY